MLNQLHLAGVLGSQSAVLWGDFGKPLAATYDRGYGLPSVLKHVRDVFDVPVATGLPFGHVPKKVTLPVGSMAQLSVKPTGFELTFI
jgi:muramoyltetrapeptide carboxypeptidase